MCRPQENADVQNVFFKPPGQRPAMFWALRAAAGCSMALAFELCEPTALAAGISVVFSIKSGPKLALAVLKVSIILNESTDGTMLPSYGTFQSAACLKGIFNPHYLG